ncbi:MAG: hypothetical protein HY240_01670, partial [Actinobacteria bacterium]|nr:hypothetical protein [Actinomycetota bacterium]
ERSKALEEQVAALQEQYRGSLTELQAAQRKLQEAATTGGAGRADARLEERLLKAEGHARLLEGQLAATNAERDKLGKEVTEVRHELARASRPDPGNERKAQQIQKESIALRAELEGTRTELDVAKRELATQQTRAKDLESQLESVHGVAIDAEQLRTELQDLRGRAVEAERMQAELESLRGGAQEAEASEPSCPPGRRCRRSRPTSSRPGVTRRPLALSSMRFAASSMRFAPTPIPSAPSSSRPAQPTSRSSPPGTRSSRSASSRRARDCRPSSSRSKRT